MNNRIVGISTQVMVMAIIIYIILLFVGVGVLVLVHICVVGRAIRRGINTIGVDRNSGGRNGMSKDDLERLPCFHYESGGEKRSPVSCAVCLEDFQRGDRCRLLPICRHSFHAQCVDSWLMKSPVCPICRTSTKSKGVNDLEGGRSPICGVQEFGSAQPVAVGIPVSPDPSSLPAVPLHGSPAVSSALQNATVGEMISAINS